MADIFKTFFLLICISVTFVHPQSQFIEPKFDRISPIVIPNCVLQDSYGFIWIGAQEGLLRYDGYKFKRYAQIPFDSTSISNNWVNVIKEDKKGNLWIGTWGGGLNYFDQKTQKFTRYTYEKNKPKTISNINISSIIINNDGSLWLGTQDPGLIHVSFDSGGQSFYKHYNLSIDPEPQPRSGENFVLDLHKDRKGNLWIGTINDGLKLLEPETGNIIRYKHDPDNPASLSSNTVGSICEDDSGNLWIGTGTRMWRYGKGLNKFNPNTGQFTHFRHDPENPASLCSDHINSLLIDQQGIMWIGTVNNYLNSIPISELLSGRKPHFTHYSNFDRNCINSLYEDRLGNIWISLFGRAVHKYNQPQNRFIWYRYIKGDPNSLWTSGGVVQVDKAGNIWFGTGGLDCYNPITGQFTHYYHQPDNPSGLSSNITTSICEDNHGFYWIGTDNGLNRLDPKTGIFHHIEENKKDPFGLQSNLINEVLASRTGNLWVASAEVGIQLYAIEENRFYHFDLDPNRTEDEGIVGIYEDHSGRLWCQTINDGLYALKIKDYQIESVKHYIHNPNNRNSLSYNQISDVIRPRIRDTSAVWIGTGNGLNRLDLNTETFNHYYIKDGLPDNMILKVLEDNEGNIWCSCAIGIAVYDIKTGKITSYDKGDGMPTVEFASRTQNACKTSDGQLIFGAAIGALGLYPEELRGNPHIPPIRLTDFKVFNKSINLDTAIQFKKRIVLSHNQNMFSFEFSALNYTNPEKNQYAYKMEGLYDEWVKLGYERTVSFTSLDPGEYIFRAKGSNNHGIWNEEGDSIRIIIDPPFWQTSWFRILTGTVLLIALIWTVRYFTTRKLKLRLQELEYQRKLDGERERISKDMHDEVGSSLTRIAILSELAKKGIPTDYEGKEHIDDISETSREVVDNIGEIIWAISPQNDSLENLIAYTRQYVSKYFEATSIHCVFDLPEKVPTVSISAEFRRNIFLIIKEAVTNIVKHACASEVLVHIQLKNNLMTIEITDNGKGFCLKKRPQFGNGLTNMKNRIEQLRGKWRINSTPGEGTKIQVAVNLRSEIKE
jgi:signal transduction histidine kinase/ligand-binding sensor domain-containing protein